MSNKYSLEKYNGNNIDKIKNFSNSSDSLTKYLREFTTKKYKENESKMYFILNEEKNPLLCFSLRCGQLFEPFIDVQEKHKDIYYKLKKLVDEMNKLKAKENSYNSYNTKKKLSELNNEIHNILQTDIELYDVLCKIQSQEDEQLSLDSGCLNIKDTFSALEIEAFFKNTSLPTNKKFGVDIFWDFIVPIVIEISDKVGCKYLYLFAADTSKDTDNKKLIKYYREELFFDELKETSRVLRPEFDNNCYALCQETLSLKEYKEKKDYDEFEKSKKKEESQKTSHNN